MYSSWRFIIAQNNDNKINSLISDFPKIEDITDNLLKDKDSFYNHLDKEIYRQYAPYKFMYTYKYEIYEIAKNADIVNFDAEEYIDNMLHCEGNLPEDILFNNFNSLYSRLTINLDLIYDAGNFDMY